ncbi:MAG: type II toxin-antitoxin system RelE/ParE family toxin [Candidatus Omnitrophica bacterium]|nr:type II toxin-antitoxin system RelE/ParE family toxin [Candidatus Omnitrophota bacterium]
MTLNKYQIIFYETSSAQCPVDHFLDTLQIKVRAKAEKWIEKLEQHGPNLPRPYADMVVGKIRELRIIFGSNHYRFLYFFFGKKIVLTHGFIKKTDKVPLQEIQRAESYMTDFLTRYQGVN